MIQSKRRPIDPIPKFATREEKAEFWDTHDLADYWDQLEPVKVKFGGDVTGQTAISLNVGELDKVRGLAIEQGVSPGALMRRWILDRLDGKSS